uniref:Uncharacterized protein n=1 Tax=Aegilops tauschii subsp. strangulata TaxID=200361 RepID=A0A453QN67_AEGTS
AEQWAHPRPRRGLRVGALPYERSAQTSLSGGVYSKLLLGSRSMLILLVTECPELET